METGCIFFSLWITGPLLALWTDSRIPESIQPCHPCSTAWVWQGICGDSSFHIGALGALAVLHSIFSWICLDGRRTANTQCMCPGTFSPWVSFQPCSDLLLDEEKLALGRTVLLQVHLKKEKVEFHSWKHCWETWDLPLTQKSWHQCPFGTLQIVPCLQPLPPMAPGWEHEEMLPSSSQGWFVSPNPEPFTIFIFAFCFLCRCAALEQQSGLWFLRNVSMSFSVPLHSKITVSLATAFIAFSFPLFLRLSSLISWNSVTKSTQKARAVPCVLNTYSKTLS